MKTMLWCLWALACRRGIMRHRRPLTQLQQVAADSEGYFAAAHARAINQALGENRC